MQGFAQVSVMFVASLEDTLELDPHREVLLSQTLGVGTIQRIALPGSSDISERSFPCNKPLLHT
jgi:hypothetical protein